MREIYLSKTFDILKKLFYIHLVFLVFMTLFRVVFFNYYLELDSFDNYYFDILNAFFLGFRIDFTVVGYIQVLPTFALIALYYIKKDSLYRLFTSFLKYYLFFTYFIVAILLFADFGFYSYFKEHINLLFFGLFEDDTSALMVTFWQNYNVVGLLENLSVGKHTIRVAAKNRNILNDGGASGSNSAANVTYNDRNPSCTNTNANNNDRYLPNTGIQNSILSIQIQENPSILN